MPQLNINNFNSLLNLLAHAKPLLPETNDTV